MDDGCKNEIYTLTTPPPKKKKEIFTYIKWILFIFLMKLHLVKFEGQKSNSAQISGMHNAFLAYFFSP